MPELKETLARLRECHERECGRGSHPGSVHASLDLLRPEELAALLQRSQEKDKLLLDAAEESERIVACELGHAYNQEYTKCPTCGFYGLKAEAAKLRADKERLLDVLRRATTLDHVDGCLFKADRRMPCQCGFNEKRAQLERDGRSALREMDAKADPRKEKAE